MAGVLLILADAIWRLLPKAIEALSGPLSTIEKVGLVAVVFFMGAIEGYRGFQKAFSPRVAARALALAHRGRAARWLAPLFCMALFDATPRRLVISWGLVLFIVGLIVGVRILEQPWRGIIDAGVIVGLTWGALSIVYCAVSRPQGVPRRYRMEVAEGGIKAV